MCNLTILCKYKRAFRQHICFSKHLYTLTHRHTASAFQMLCKYSDFNIWCYCWYVCLLGCKFLCEDTLSIPIIIIVSRAFRDYKRFILRNSYIISIKTIRLACIHFVCLSARLHEYHSQIHASTACNFTITSHKRIPNNHCCCFEFIVALPLSLSMICLRYGNFQPIENHIVWLKIRLYRVNSCVCVCVCGCAQDCITLWVYSMRYYIFYAAIYVNGAPRIHMHTCTMTGAQYLCRIVNAQ